MVVSELAKMRIDLLLVGGSVCYTAKEKLLQAGIALVVQASPYPPVHALLVSPTCSHQPAQAHRCKPTCTHPPFYVHTTPTDTAKEKLLQAGIALVVQVKPSLLKRLFKPQPHPVHNTVSAS